MGASVGAGRKGGGRRRRGVPRYGAMADINMTPFIDVMLVLLIIFMVAAPLLTSGVAVDLPQAKAGQLNVDQKPVAITIDEKSQVFLADQPVADADFVETLKTLSKGDTETRIFVRASKGVPYGRVAQILAEVTTSGFRKVALQTDPDSH